MAQNDPQSHASEPLQEEEKREGERVQEGERAQEAQRLTEQLEEEVRKAEEYLDLLRRTQADFMNYKRRAAQEQAQERIVAQSDVIEQLLPLLDDLGRALVSIPPELSNHPWVQGILLIARRLIGTLEQMGVRQIGQPGERFDPHWHEAVMTAPQPDTSSGVIVDVVRPGYIIGERIIRPAQVVVAS